MTKTMKLASGLFLACYCAVSQAELPDFVPLVEQASGAVVNISTKTHAPPVLNQIQIPEIEGLPPFFRDFFESIPKRIPKQEGDYGRESRSLGSGFIISQDGYIITNHHVIDKADEVVVRLSDRSEYKAQIIGSDQRTDVALLKIEAKEKLPVIKIGNSDDLKVGEWVLAIGSPFGFDHSATAGIISATSRNLPNDNFVPFIQTDVAINPGNSGGPLFNLNGEVIGINSQIFTRSGGFMGLSFAIPIATAMDIVNQLKTDGKVTRGWIGIALQEVTKDLAESFKLDKPMGALVTQILETGPASKSDIAVGDIITKFNGHSINMSSDLPKLVASTHPGTTVNIEVIRDGSVKNMEIKLGAMPDDNSSVATNADGGRLGIVIADIDNNKKSELNIVGGVLIKDIKSDIANNIGLRSGDIITHINNQAIEDSAKFNTIVRELKANNTNSMRVIRGNQAVFLTFKLN